MNFTKRGSTLYLRKRVPQRFRAVEEREYVWLSLFTDSEVVAKAKASKVWTQMLDAWEAKLDGAKDEGEGAMLTRAQIRLDANVPHISIEPVNGRQLKTANARRVIPLVGVSLEAFRENPDGFQRYADNPSLSDTVNKFLRENKLLETPRHTLYSLRHSFEDRMLAAGIDERIRRDVLGHALNRERYGAGASLEQVAGLLQGIAV